MRAGSRKHSHTKSRVPTLQTFQAQIGIYTTTFVKMVHRQYPIHNETYKMLQWHPKICLLFSQLLNNESNLHGQIVSNTSIGHTENTFPPWGLTQNFASILEIQKPKCHQMALFYSNKGQFCTLALAGPIHL